MCRKMTHLVAFILIFTLFSPICRGVGNHNALQEEIVIIPNTAHNPEPPDGTIHKDIWVKLSWSPGLHSASHDVYIGNNFDDVNKGASDTFWGNYNNPFVVIGFPEFVYRPDILKHGATIYWRVDEVNDLHPDSPWKGKIWSFSIPSEIAHDANPPDGAKFIEPNVTLSWTAGLHAVSHTVYIGDSFDDVNDASGGLSQETTSYNPGTLEFEKTYYWRVDEYDGYTTKKGDVWSFTTKPFDPNLAYYPHPPDGAKHGDLWALLQWSPGRHAASHDLYIGKNYDDVINGTNETYDTFWGNQDELFQVIGFHDWTGRFMDLMNPGVTIYWRIDEVNDLHPDSPWKGNIWSFWITPKTAHEPNPPDGAEFVKPNVTLSWTEGFGAKLHTVYFGDNFEDVNNASGGQYQHATTYNPGLLEFDKTYYWRVDEYDAVGTYKGEVWNFTTKSYDPNIAYDPQPHDNAIHGNTWANLQWSPGRHAVSHDVFIGKNIDDVKNATNDRYWIFWGNQDNSEMVIGFDVFDGRDIGLLVPGEKVYWRIDEVNDLHPDSPWKGNVWSFTTGTLFWMSQYPHN